jgi:exonuclease SbcD
MMAGGVEDVPVSVFPEDVVYVALGHLHLGQEPGERVAYSGSPIPLSFGERGYGHRVLLIDLEPVPGARPTARVRALPVPRSVPVESWPNADEGQERLSAAEALLRVRARPAAPPGQADLPLVQIRLAAGATAVHKREIEEAAIGKDLRLLHVELAMERSEGRGQAVARLGELTPRLVFIDEWAREYPNEPLPADVLAAFDEAVAAVSAERA